jgi:hypothetical protein
MDIPVFDQIASSLTVKAICSQLGPDIALDADEETLGEIFSDPDRTFDPMNDPCRVIGSDGRTVGMLWFEMLTVGGSTLRDVVQPLVPHELLTSATTVLDAVQLFGAKGNDYFFILHVCWHSPLQRPF